MLRKICISSFIACLFVSMGLVSCTKQEKQPTTTSRIIGNWKKVQYATDDNGNGVLDEWEVRNVSAGLVNKLEFKKDSTGIEYTTNSPDLPFTWVVSSELTMVFTYNNSEPIVYKITRINSSVLNLTTKTKNGLAGYYYERN